MRSHVSVFSLGENVARKPCLFAMLYIVSRVNTSASAACSGGRGPVTTSYCNQSEIMQSCQREHVSRAERAEGTSDRLLT